MTKATACNVFSHSIVLPVLPVIFSSVVLCFGDDFFGRSFYFFQRVLCVLGGDEFFWAAHYWLLAAHYFQWGVMFWGRIFLGPIGQEADAKTVIISGLAVTAGQFPVIIIKLHRLSISLTRDSSPFKRKCHNNKVFANLSFVNYFPKWHYDQRLYQAAETDWETSACIILCILLKQKGRRPNGHL